MARPRASRRDSIEQFQRVSGGIDGESGDAASRLAFILRQLIHGIKKSLIRVNRQEGRILSFGYQPDWRGFAGRAVEGVGINAFTGRTRISADVHGSIVRVRSRRAASRGGLRSGVEFVTDLPGDFFPRIHLKIDERFGTDRGSN